MGTALLEPEVRVVTEDWLDTLPAPAKPVKTSTWYEIQDERIADAAAVLDEHKPGWADKLDLDTLDLNSGRYCILGQLFQSSRLNFLGYRGDGWGRGSRFLEKRGYRNFGGVFCSDEDKSTWLVEINKRRTV